MNYWIRLLKKYLPTSLLKASVTETFFSANYVFIHGTVALFLAGFSLIYYYLGHQEMMSLCLYAFLISVGSLWLYYKIGNKELSGNIMMVGSYLSIVGGAFYTGGINGGGVIFVPTAAAICYFVLTKKSATTWLAVFFVTLILLPFASSFGIKIQNLPFEWQNSLINTLCLIGSTYLLAMFSVTSLFAREMSQKIIEDKKTEIEKHMFELQKTKNDLSKELESNKVLLKVLGHDLATPLAVIQGTIDIMSMEENPALEKNLSRMDRAVKNLKDIIVHVREIQAIRSGKKTLDLEAVCVEDSLKNIVDNFTDKLKDKNIELIIVREPVARKTYLLAEQTSFINSVMNNLVSNAIKFSFKNSKIIIGYKISESKVHLWVKDSGMGMSDELVSKLFDMTAQTSRLGSEGEKGTGFGLPLMKSYLDLYGASVDVKSISKDLDPENCGTCFNLYFKKTTSELLKNVA